MENNVQELQMDVRSMGWPQWMSLSRSTNPTYDRAENLSLKFDLFPCSHYIKTFISNYWLILKNRIKVQWATRVSGERVQTLFCHQKNQFQMCAMMMMKVGNCSIESWNKSANQYLLKWKGVYTPIGTAHIFVNRYRESGVSLRHIY